MPQITRDEPLVTVATITALVTAILALLTAFGSDLSEEQQTAILGVVAVIAPLVVGLIARSKVRPVADGGRTDTEIAGAETGSEPADGPDTGPDTSPDAGEGTGDEQDGKAP